MWIFPKNLIIGVVIDEIILFFIPTKITITIANIFIKKPTIATQR